MKNIIVKLFSARLILACAGSASAAVRYVDANSTNSTPPYISWATAATNIQDAVDAAAAGDEIVVTNGTYASGGRATAGDGTTNRVALNKPLSLRSVSGPLSTVIDGGHSGRCGYVTNGASLSGFTLTNGFVGYFGGGSFGGGLWCESTNAVVSNCVVTGNAAFNDLFAFGGGAYGGTLNNCTLTGNSAIASTSTPGVLPVAQACGGGAASCTLNNCTLTGNAAVGGSDRFVPIAGYGNGGGAAFCTLNNCTLSGNSARGVSLGGLGGVGGRVGGGAYCSALNNCIVYFNTDGGNGDGMMSYCCTTPDPGGFGNITNAPLFVDQASGNLRLQSNSPCINAGRNAFAPAGPDLDGNPRIAGGTVDIGACEFQSPTSIISYAWLQQYGLPTDGSADFTDPDGDGMNNWQEWICGTDPTNALSVLRMPRPTPGVSGVGVSWQSVDIRTYFLERSSNLSAQPAFLPLATNIPGQIGTTTFIDTNAIGAGPWFYRVGVSAR